MPPIDFMLLDTGLADSIDGFANNNVLVCDDTVKVERGLSNAARPLPINISTLMRSLPPNSKRARRDRTSSRTARRSAAASRK